MNLLPLSGPRVVAPDTEALTTYVELPSLGLLAVNAFLVRAREPVLVDTGVPAHADDFVRKVDAAISLAELRWIWLTHADPDHTGALAQLLERAPAAKLVSTFLGMGKLGLTGAIDPARFYLVNPGQTLDVGDRRLRAIAPPTFDAPETTCAIDEKTKVLFSADCFGALLEKPADGAADVPEAALRRGMITWATVDAPWLAIADEAKLARSLDSLRRVGARAILSTHLPPAYGMDETLLSHVAAARTAPRWVGPDQKALMAMAAA